jgi:hypothetical protein
MPIILGAVAIVLITIVVNYAQIFLAKRYSRSISSLASELNLLYSAEEQPAVPFGNLLLFSLGTPQNRQDIMQGIYKDTDIAAYVYSYSLDLGKVQEIHSQSVIQIREMKLKLPQFNLYPQKHTDFLINMLPTKEAKDSLLEFGGIRLQNHPDFRSEYKLLGGHIQQLAQLFDNDSILECIVSLNDAFEGLVCVEGMGHNLFIYPLSKKLSPGDLVKLLDQSIELSQQLENKMQT